MFQFRPPLFRRLIACTLLLALNASLSRASDYSWSGPGGAGGLNGNWNLSTNWSSSNGGVSYPLAGDNALIGFLGTTYTVTISDTEAVNNLTIASGTIGALGNLSQTSGSAFTLYGTFTNNSGYSNTGGSFTLASGAAYLGQSGSSFTLNNGSTLTINTGASYTLNSGSSATINSGANYNLNGGAVTTNINLNFSSGSTLNFTAGTLAAPSSTVAISGTFTWSGGTFQSGTINAYAGGALSGSSNYLNGAALTLYSSSTLAGSLNIDNGSVLTFGSGSTVTTTSGIAISRSSNVGTATISNAGFFVNNLTSGSSSIGANITFNNTGTIQLLSGSLTQNGNGTNSGTWTLNGGSLTLQPLASYTLGSGTNITLDNGSILSTTLGATLSTNAGVNISRSNGTGSGTFSNAGTFINDSNTSNSNIQSNVTFNNTGTVQANSGILLINANGTNTGSFLLNGGTLSIESASNYTFGSGAAISYGTANSGVFQVNSGTLNVNASVPSVNLTFLNGTIQGTGIFNVSGPVNWYSGTFAGSVTVNANGGLNTNAGSMFINAASVNIGGSSTWIGTLYMDNGATLTNNSGATITSTAGFSISRYNSVGIATFLNAGTLINDSNTTNSNIQNNVTFNNTGTVQANSGILLINANGTNTGSFLLNGGTISIESASIYNLNSGASIVYGASNSGVFQVNGGTLNVNASIPSVKLTFLNGTIQGSGTLNISGPTNWNSGTFAGSVTVNANGGLNTNAGSMFINAASVNIGGSSTWNGTIYMDNGATLINNSGATITSTAGFSISRYNSVGIATFLNAGTLINDSSTTNSNLQNNVTFNNTGTVQANSGLLLINASGTSTGAFALNGGTISIESASIYNLNSGASIVYGASNSGTFQVNGGTLNVNSNIPAVNLKFNSGTIQGSGTLNISGATNWYGGTFAGAVTVNANGGLNTNAGSMFINAASVNIGGSSTWNGTLYMDNGATLTNNSGATITSTAGFAIVRYYGTGDATFLNAGTLINDSSTTNSNLQNNVTFNNTGTVQANSGLLLINASGTSTGAFALNGGTISIESASIYNLNSGASIVYGASNSGVFQVNGGTLNVNSTISAVNLKFNSGTIQGTGTLNVSGATTWNGGTFGGAATINANGGLNITGSSSNFLNGAAVNAGGTSTWSGTSYIDGNSVLTINAGATVTNNTSSGLYRYNDQGTASFVVAGQFINSANYTVSSSISFSNTGIVQTVTGFLDVSNATLPQLTGGTLSGGSWLVGDNTTLNFGSNSISTIGTNTLVQLGGPNATFAALNLLATNNGTLNVIGGANFTPTGGSISNNGTIFVGSSSTVNAAVNVNNGAKLYGIGSITGALSVASGGSLFISNPNTNAPGILNASSSVTLSAGSTFNVYLNGNTAGSGYSQLKMVAGQTLSAYATLNVVLNYGPTMTDKYFIIINGTNASNSTFNGLPQNSQVSLGTYGGNSFYGYISYTGNAATDSITGGNDVVIYNPAPEPGSLLALTAVLGLGCYSRRKRQVLTNLAV